MNHYCAMLELKYKGLPLISSQLPTCFCSAFIYLFYNESCSPSEYRYPGRLSFCKSKRAETSRPKKYRGTKVCVSVKVILNVMK